MWGDAVLGWVTIDGGDMWWVLGQLTPGPAFALAKPLLEREFAATELSNAADDASYSDLADAQLDALEAINRVQLTLGQDRVPVYDFKTTDVDGDVLRVEFRLQR